MDASFDRLSNDTDIEFELLHSEGSANANLSLLGAHGDVEKGEHTWRILLAGTDKLQFAVEALLVHKDDLQSPQLRDHEYILIGTKGVNKVLLKISDIAKRLRISKDILTAYRDDFAREKKPLIELFKSRVELLVKYEQMLSDQHYSEMRATGKVVDTLSDGSILKLELKDHQVVQLTTKEFLGSGSTVTAWKITNALTFETYVFKAPNIQANDDALSAYSEMPDVVKFDVERSILSRFNGRVGLQRQEDCHIVTTMDGQEGLLGCYYNSGNLQTYQAKSRQINPSDTMVEANLEACSQLLDGLCYAHSINIVNSDIKPENILVKLPSSLDRVFQPKNRRGIDKPRFDIADWRNGRDLSIKTDRHFRATKGYFVAADLELVNKAQSNLHFDKDAYILRDTVAKKMDVYALGMTQYKFLLGESTLQERFANRSPLFREKLKNYFDSLLEANHEERVTIFVAQKMWQEIVRIFISEITTQETTNSGISLPITADAGEQNEAGPKEKVYKRIGDRIVVLTELEQQNIGGIPLIESTISKWLIAILQLNNLPVDGTITQLVNKLPLEYAKILERLLSFSDNPSHVSFIVKLGLPSDKSVNNATIDSLKEFAQVIESLSTHKELFKKLKNVWQSINESTNISFHSRILQLKCYKEAIQKDIQPDMALILTKEVTEDSYIAINFLVTKFHTTPSIKILFNNFYEAALKSGDRVSIPRFFNMLERLYNQDNDVLINQLLEQILMLWDSNPSLAYKFLDMVQAHYENTVVALSALLNSTKDPFNSKLLALAGSKHAALIDSLINLDISDKENKVRNDKIRHYFISFVDIDNPGNINLLMNLIMLKNVKHYALFDEAMGILANADGKDMTNKNIFAAKAIEFLSLGHGHLRVAQELLKPNGGFFKEHTDLLDNLSLAEAIFDAEMDFIAASEGQQFNRQELQKLRDSFFSNIKIMHSSPEQQMEYIGCFRFLLFQRELHGSQGHHDRLAALFLSPEEMITKVRSDLLLVENGIFNSEINISYFTATKALAACLMTYGGSINITMIQLLKNTPFYKKLPTDSAIVDHLTSLETNRYYSERWPLINAPASKSRQEHIIQAMIGKGDNYTPTLHEVRIAILSAFLAPMRQSNAGNCFCIGPSIEADYTEIGKMQKLEDFIFIQATGKLTRGGVDIPLVMSKQRTDIESNVLAKVRIDMMGTLSSNDIMISNRKDRIAEWVSAFSDKIALHMKIKTDSDEIKLIKEELERQLNENCFVGYFSDAVDTHTGKIGLWLLADTANKAMENASDMRIFLMRIMEKTKSLILNKSPSTPCADAFDQLTKEISDESNVEMNKLCSPLNFWGGYIHDVLATYYNQKVFQTNVMMSADFLDCVGKHLASLPDEEAEQVKSNAKMLKSVGVPGHHFNYRIGQLSNLSKKSHEIREAALKLGETEMKAESLPHFVDIYSKWMFTEELQKKEFKVFLEGLQKPLTIRKMSESILEFHKSKPNPLSNMKIKLMVDYALRHMQFKVPSILPFFDPNWQNTTIGITYFIDGSVIPIQGLNGWIQPGQVFVEEHVEITFYRYRSPHLLSLHSYPYPNIRYNSPDIPTVALA